MNPNSLTIDFLARCLSQGAFDKTEATTLLHTLGKAIDQGIVYGHDVAEIQHCHDVLTNLIAEL